MYLGVTERLGLIRRLHPTQRFRHCDIALLATIGPASGAQINWPTRATQLPLSGYKQGGPSVQQSAVSLRQTNDLWVTANFKETQLARIHPGQHVDIPVDALHDDFEGTVESMPAVTGSRTSVLPPENATGNYVKVIQRLSVRIRFNSGQKDIEKLRPGMSVEPRVRLN